VSQSYFQKGFDLKAAVAPALHGAYSSAIVERFKQAGYAVRAGDLVLRLAREFGFCYGVDRAVEYAYETREKFPERRLFLSGEIIHNPEVNARLRELGIVILDEGEDDAQRYREVRPEDVVILPAFGVTAGQMSQLREKGCVLVDTTCGSVLNVWKNVRAYARDGYTSVIHGKHHHEETKATASQAFVEGGHYLCVRDKSEAGWACDFIRGTLPGAELMRRLGHAASPGFEPSRDLQRIGLANQTTMLMGESVEIQELLRAAMRERWGEAELPARLRAFDTICSATQDRQDAVQKLLASEGLDLMVVIGGYNSSNTMALARLCAERLPTYHISGPECLEGAAIRFKPVGGQGESSAPSWLPKGPVTLGLTAGASTPNSVVGQVVEKLLALRGRTAGDLVAA
jgi:4-hydroxy-3-methylbut-2-enyl diphosphate reductase